MKRKADLAEIGSLTRLSFPDYGMTGIPAKVDTGADSSSIWASNINEVGGKLSFVLFDTFSPYYSGEKIAVKNYSLRTIKNSFGKSELRYKVTMPVMIENKTIKVKFTLANRSNNRFPVLIGRRTLQNRFIVNVAKTPKQQVTEILVIVNKHINSVNKFFDNIEQNTDRQMKFNIVTFDDLVFRVSKKQVQINIAKGKELSRYNLVYIKSVGRDHYNLAATISQYCHERGIACFDEALSDTPAINKLQQYVKLCQRGINVPKTIYLSPDKLDKSFSEIKAFVGLPFVLKDSNGEKGRNNFLINNKKDFIKACEKATKQGIHMIAQQYIHNDGDFRLLVLGENVELIIHRQAQTKTHLNNTSAGGQAKLMTPSSIPAKVQALAIKAATVLQWNVAGVDIIRDKKTGAWYCLEVNNSPQIASGSFVADKEAVLTDFLQKTARVQLEES